MNLIIEQGNTSTKVAVYGKQGCMEASQVYKDFSPRVVASFFEEYDLRQGIMSTVIEPDDELLAFFNDRLPYFIFFDENTPVPISIQYQTPQTLGKDRLAAVVGANYLKPGKNILVIDAGTAITYELIDASGAYLGGNISPGMTTRFKALNRYASKLPLVQEAEDIPQIGYSTKTAIQAGVVKGITYEMEGYIEDLRREYPSLLVFLTGGNSFYFERRLKNTIFADINLVLTGLNRILEYNVEN
ncbi:MAG: type III pantothenate kinase [Tannerellaceae bacterium]|jgi:type III pantothenate kinase|nr:type III pantothenate kinase [Tannerellaceae bacterium]